MDKLYKHRDRFDGDKRPGRRLLVLDLFDYFQHFKRKEAEMLQVEASNCWNLKLLRASNWSSKFEILSNSSHHSESLPDSAFRATSRSFRNKVTCVYLMAHWLACQVGEVTLEPLCCYVLLLCFCFGCVMCALLHVPLVSPFRLIDTLTWNVSEACVRCRRSHRQFKSLNTRRTAEE